MEYRRFDSKVVVRMDRGEEILEQLQRVAQQEEIRLASVSALGAVDDFTVGIFDVTEKKYYPHHFTGNHEIVSLTGTINTMNGEYYAHLHMSAAGEQGFVVGGHLNRAVISATCEMVLDIIDGSVDRTHSEELGLNMFRFD